VKAAFGNQKSEILEWDERAENDNLYPSDKSTRDDNPSRGLTATNECKFRDDHRRQEKREKHVQSLQRKRSRLSEQNKD
jgi:hypothetical protein